MRSVLGWRLTIGGIVVGVGLLASTCSAGDSGDRDASPPTTAPEAGVSWASVPVAPIAPRSLSATVFTGREVIVWGGTTREADPGARSVDDSRMKQANALSDGAAYDIVTRQWRTLSAAPLSPRYLAIAIWDGD